MRKTQATLSKPSNMKSVFDLSKYRRKDTNSKLLTQIKQAAADDPYLKVEGVKV